MKLKQRLPYKNELERKLKNLEKELNDAIKRFTLLSKIAESDNLVSFYQEKLEDRKQFKLDVVSFYDGLNIKKEFSGTVSGAFSRLHTKLKIIFDNDGDQVSLTKATYHEESLLYEYDFILKKTELLPEALSKLTNKQRAAIKQDIDKLISLNDYN